MDLAPTRPSGGALGGGSAAHEGAVAHMENHPMPKSNPVDETRIADAVEPTKRQQRSHAKKAGRTTKARPKRQARSKGAVASRSQDETCDQETD